MILQLASAFLILAVIVAVPELLAVTFPYVLTDATFELLDFHVGFFPLEVRAII